jgi:hypothetical protein
MAPGGPDKIGETREPDSGTAETSWKRPCQKQGHIPNHRYKDAIIRQLDAKLQSKGALLYLSFQSARPKIPADLVPSPPRNRRRRVRRTGSRSIEDIPA